MGVFEKPKGSGIWWADFHINGKRRRVKVGTKKRALDYAAKSREKARMAKLFPEEHQADLTVKEMVEKYLPLFEARRSYKDFQRYAVYCVEEFGSFIARQLKPSDIEAYRVRRQTEGASGGTINRCMAFLRRVYNIAINDDILIKNPVARLKKLPERGILEEDWTPGEEQSILAACQPKHQRMILMLLLTGMRGGELLGRKVGGKWTALAWEEVDFEKKQIQLEETKGGRPRRVPISSQLKALLEEQREAVPGNCKWVFPGRNPKEPYRRNGAYQVLQRACDRAGVPRKRLHSTRHAFCSQLLMATGDLKTVSELAGHCDVTITAKLYVRVTDRHKHRSLDQLAEFRARERVEAGLQNRTLLSRAD